MKSLLLPLTALVASVGLTAQTQRAVENLASEDRVVYLNLQNGAIDRLWHAEPGSVLTENPDGTASLVLDTYNVNDPSLRLRFDVALDGFVAAGHPAPGGSPRTNSAVVNAGIDTSTWRYYQSYTGTVVGSDNLDGFSADITLRGEALQIGDGANLKDLSFGIASWFRLQNVVQSQVTNLPFRSGHEGDFNLTLGGGSTSDCVENLSNANRAVWLSLNTGAGVGRYWTALEGAVLTENPDGTAELRAALVNRENDNLRLSFVVQLSGLVRPGSPAPGGSPRTTSAVLGAGIDTNLWHYYTNLTGTIRGRAQLEGFSADISRRGEALQIGDGANLMDLSYGLASWFNISNIVQSPITPLNFSSHNGDFNLTLGSNCVCLAGREASWSNYGDGLAGCGGVQSYTLSGDPITGHEVTLQFGNAGTDPAFCTVLFSDAPNDLFVDVLGGTVLVALPTIASASIAVPPGGLDVLCCVPLLPCIAMTDIYTQSICPDACAAGGFAMSRGLHMVLGDL